MLSTKITEDINEACAVLMQGQVVAIPTETVYGLAANALDVKAVIKIFEAKKRPFFDPLIVHLKHASELDKYAVNIVPQAYALAKAFWPGPLTLVLQRSALIPDMVTSGLDTVALRVPAHPLAHQILSLLSFPLAAPSANPFGYISPTTAQHVLAQLQGHIPLIVDGGPCTVGVESTIVQCTHEGSTVLRLGGTSVESIEAIVGKVNVNVSSSSNPQAPGMLTTHYAPRKPILIGNIDELLAEHSSKKIAVLSFQNEYKTPFCKVLSLAGNMNEAAQNLFSMMRELDATDADVIIAEFVPAVGLGLAINDRLQRAASK
jgi:L-threonylcarbamoyladenylate synthase